MGSDSRPVCHRCAQIKQACDGNLPCARCVRLSLPCRPRSSPTAAGGDHGGTAVGVGGGIIGDDDMPKARIRRVQTGCLMCKRRKKKCDETKPRCGDCRRLCLDCEWPPERRSRAAAAAAAVASHHPITLVAAGFVPADSPGSGPGSLMDMPIRSTPSPASSPASGHLGSGSSPGSFADHHSLTFSHLPDQPLSGGGGGLGRQFLERQSLDRQSLGDQSLGGGAPSLGGQSLAGQSLLRGQALGGDQQSLLNHQSTHHSSSSLDQTSSLLERRQQLLHHHHTSPPLPSLDPPVIMAVTDPSKGSPGNHMALELINPDSSGSNLSWDVTSASPLAWLDSLTPDSGGGGGGDSPSASAGAASPSSSLSLYVPQLLPQLRAPQDKALLNHYSTIVSTILSRRNSITNPYNHYLLPLAQSNDLVLHCILALSANHWHKLQPTLGDRGLYHKSRATQELASLLPHVDKTSADLALVSSLLLCMTELFDGTSEGWKLHLRGAKRLLMTLKKQQGGMLTGHYKFLLRLARFLDSAATTSTCRPPLIGQEGVEAAALDRMTASPDEEDSAVYGIPKELFHLIDRVNTLADLRSTRVDAASEAVFRKHARDIEERIDRWSIEYGGFSRAAWTLSPADDDVVHAAAAFEHAIRLRLHQVVEGYELTDPKVGNSVEGILEAVQKIRYGSPLESCLVFPLVMAGGACWQLEHRVIIQDRLLVMERTCGFGYIYNARDLVERVWSRRDQAEGTGDVVNWASIRHYEMNGLVLF